MASEVWDHLRKVWRGFVRIERRVLVAWIRYAKANRQSNVLPFLLFILLYFDAFVMVIPSMLLVAVATTIQPRRWFLFALIFVIAVVGNNSTTYAMGRLLPPDWIFYWVESFGVEFLWEGAVDAVAQYGPFATFIGGFLPLPTQLVTLLLGLADAQRLHLADLNGLENLPRTSIGVAIAFAALGHGIKITAFAAVIRYGWHKIENRLSS